MNGNGTRAIFFPTWEPECNDTERRSLIKINKLMGEALQELKDLEIDIDKIELGELPDIIKELRDISIEIRDGLDELKQIIADLDLGDLDFTELLEKLDQLLKKDELIRTTSGSFVSHFIAFSGPTGLRQIDCFSIAHALRWVFVFDGQDTTTFPIYIAPIWPNCSTSFMCAAPFQDGVTVGFSIHPTVYQEAGTELLVTAVATAALPGLPPSATLWDGGASVWDNGNTNWLS